MSIPLLRDRYDVVIAGARVAGAATGMLLARSGLKVLVVDPARRGADTLSTHALMRGGVLQLHRWGVLDRVRAAGTPLIAATTFHYGSEAIEVVIKPRDGVDGLFAPRRTVLDRVLVEAAEEAGADVVHGVALEGLVEDAGGRVRGAFVASRSDRTERRISADLVIGADGARSRVAKLVGSEVLDYSPNATTSIYGYWPGLELEGTHWYYEEGFGAGAIPTNGGEWCVFVGLPPVLFHSERKLGLEWLYHRVLADAFPELASLVSATDVHPKLRAFPGAPGFLRRATGPGWALVGDAGYFRDPITAHGITDALRDAELLARAVVVGSEHALSQYGETRDGVSREMLELTDRIASLDWTLAELRDLHLRLSREMSAEAAFLGGLDETRPVDWPSAERLRRSA